MKPQSVHLFVKPGCPWCHLARRWLDERGIHYTVLDVTSNPAAYAEMRQLSGQSRAPTLQVDGRVLADFGPDELARFWATVEKERASS